MRRPRVNIAIAILALAISSLLWMVQFAQSARPTTTRTYAVPLSPNALDKQRLAITAMPESVQVVVTASEERLARLRPDTFYALVDLSKAAAGARSYPVQIFPSEFRDAAINGTLLARVALEPIKSRRVSITLDTKGELPDPSLRLESLVPDPARATVTGPKSQIEAVRRVRGFLDLADAKEGVAASTDVELEAVDGRDRVLDGVRCEPLFARARLAVAAAPEERTVLVVPSFRGSPKPGFLTKSYTITPTQIEVRGRSLILAGLAKASTETIDLAGLAVDHEFDVAVRLPEGVSAVGRARVKVRIKLQRDPSAAPAAVFPPEPAAPSSALPSTSPTSGSRKAGR